METFSYPLSSMKMPTDLHLAKSWSRNTKRKNKSVSSHRRNAPYTVLSNEKSKKKIHTRENSVIKKSKSKCDTEVNYTSKKKSIQNETLSKKTIKKRKGVQNNLRYSHNKLSQSKKRDQDADMKGKKKWPRKDMLHSTCFSRLMEPDIGNFGDYVHANSDFIQNHQSYISEESISTVVNRTKCILNAYQKKCEDLTACCNYYRKQLDKALKRMSTQKKESSVQKKKNKKMSNLKGSIEIQRKF